MKFSELIEQNVYCEGLRIGKIKDIHVDGEDWKVTHFELELTKEAAKGHRDRCPSFKRSNSDILEATVAHNSFLTHFDPFIISVRVSA
jgi:sporulation protein YlmC with PRC-barrel domain